MANHEDYLDALTAFSRDNSKEIPQILEQYLFGVAKNGETLFQWPLLKPLIVGKMECVLDELQRGLESENILSRPNVENVRFEVMRTRIMDAVHKFTGAPFTIQRLCELLIDPRRHYKRSDKFMRGLEKNVLVVSTVDPFGRKVVSEAGNKHLVNGVDNVPPFFSSRDSGISNNLPPVPGWVTSASPPAVHQEGVSSARTGSQEQTVATNGVTTDYGDQGDQPPVVHAEEVVETAVSVETSEPGPEATGAGEAMADEEDEEMGADDTNASTSSSSSSSSEEFSNSDTGEGSTGTVMQPAVVTSSSSEMVHTSPWASITADRENRLGEQAMELEANQVVPDTSKDSSQVQQDVQSAVPQPSSVANGEANSPSPMDTLTPTPSHSDSTSQATDLLTTDAISPQIDDGLEIATSISDVSEAETDRQVDDQGLQSISSSISSATPHTLPSTCTPGPNDSLPSYADVVSGARQLTREHAVSDGQGVEESNTSEQSPSFVTSTETNLSSSSSLLPESSPNKDVSSSSLHPLSPTEEVEGEQPQAKYMRLSEESELSSSSSLVPSESNIQDLEPSASSTTENLSEAEASGQQAVSPIAEDPTPSSLTAETADTISTSESAAAVAQVEPLDSSSGGGHLLSSDEQVGDGLTSSQESNPNPSRSLGDIGNEDAGADSSISTSQSTDGQEKEAMEH